MTTQTQSTSKSGAKSTAKGTAKRHRKVRILILGGGFGAVGAALQLERKIGKNADFEVTLVAHDNFSLFSPMLHEVATGFDPSAIVSPRRTMLRRTSVIEGEVEAIDLEGRRVTLGGRPDGKTWDLGFDHLLIAIGSETNFFDIPGLSERASLMKTLDDAVLLRNRMIASLEAASNTSGRERDDLLSVVVAGGGFSGVETIGAMNDFLRDALPFYPNLRGAKVHITLVHPGKIILPELGDKLGLYTREKLESRGVKVMVERRVKGFERGQVTLDDGTVLRARTLVWTAGLTSSPVLAALSCKKESKRVFVDENLAVPGERGVWSVGDCAWCHDASTGKGFPPTAQHAIRQGAHVAGNILSSIYGEPLRPFRFKMLGQLAVIGKRTGVANVLGIQFSGVVAWLMWRAVYLFKLPGLEKKIRVLTEWILDVFFPKNLVQLITLRGVETAIMQMHAVTEEMKAEAEAAEKPAGRVAELNGRAVAAPVG